VRRLAIWPLSVGAVCAGLAGALGGPAWLLAWPGAAFALVGAGYLGVGAGVLGKGPTGRRQPILAAVTWPYRGAAWLRWRGRRRDVARVWDRVTPELYLGRRPDPGELPTDVAFVVDMTAELAPPRELPASTAYRCLPTLDYAVPRADRFRALVDELAPEPGPFYVHCAAGHGRSAMFAAALLVRRGTFPDVAAAYAALRAARPGVHRNRRQSALAEAVAGRPSRPPPRPPRGTLGPDGVGGEPGLQTRER